MAAYDDDDDDHAAVRRTGETTTRTPLVSYRYYDLALTHSLETRLVN